MSKFTSLKSLELQRWDHWDNLGPLRSLFQLEEFDLICVDYGMLVDILVLGSLQALRVVTVNPRLVDQRWLKARSLDQHESLVVASDALLQLPHLLTFQAHRLPRGGKGCEVTSISKMSPEHWPGVRGKLLQAGERRQRFVRGGCDTGTFRVYH
jgi:hypothetical protein